MLEVVHEENRSASPRRSCTCGREGHWGGGGAAAALCLQTSLVTTAPGSRSAGIAMAFKLIESAQRGGARRERAHLVGPVCAGASFENGLLAERPDSTPSERVT